MLNLLLVLMHIDFGSPVKVTDLGENKPIYLADAHDEVIWSKDTIALLSQYVVGGIYVDDDVICIDAKKQQS